VSTRAGIAEDVFYEIFPSVEGCYWAAFAMGLDRLSHAVAEACAQDEAWLERVRSGLVALLGFLDDEPSWARLLLSQTPVAGTGAPQSEQRLLGIVTQLFENGGPRVLSQSVPPSSMTAELVAGGTFAVIRARVLNEPREALVELAPSLMGFIVRPYLGEAAAQAELEGKPSRTGDASPNEPRVDTISRASELPVRATHRTTLVLRAIARSPYSTNREIAQAAELTDEGQTSKLLARLERRGVIKNVGLGPARGEPNAWVLTASGRRTVNVINESFASGAPRPRRARMNEVS
jgi:AcrR family transcriptional regulator